MRVGIYAVANLAMWVGEVLVYQDATGHSLSLAAVVGLWLLSTPVTVLLAVALTEKAS